MKNWTIEEENFIRETRTLLVGEAYLLYKEKYDRSYRSFATKRSKMGCSNAEYKKLKWKPEYNSCIMNTKNMSSKRAYEVFTQKYGEIVTLTAFMNQRSRLGVSVKRPHGSTAIKELYSEHIKHDYVFIKVAQPNVWKSKARWIWEETHPGEIATAQDNFIFLDGNNRNFDPANIERISIKERTLFIQAGGVSSNPEITKLNILRARLKLAQLDYGERHNMVKNTSGGRRWINR